MKCFASIVIDAPIEKVWPVVRDFLGPAVWNSEVIVNAEITNGMAPDQVGAIRRLDVADGTFFVETLLALSDADHYLTYDILESPLAVTNYTATMQLQPITEAQGTYGTWSAEFDTQDERSEEMSQAVGTGILANGLRALTVHWLL